MEDCTNLAIEESHCHNKNGLCVLIISDCEDHLIDCINYESCHKEWNCDCQKTIGIKKI